MNQHLALDHPKRRVYYGVLLLATAVVLGCAASIKSIAPVGLAPLAEATLNTWLTTYQPKTAMLYEVRWRYLNPKGSTAGRATIRVAPPDTLRFDYRGPFGRSGAAVLVGDSALWAEPKGDAENLVPAAPLFWAALGIPQPPPEHASVSGLERNGARAWRYVVESDTMDFVESGRGPERLRTEIRRAGEIVATSDARFGPGTRIPTETRMQFPQEGAAVFFTLQRADSVAPFDASVWRHP